MEWKMAYAHHADCKGKEFSTIEALKSSGFDVLSASVPGCLELELMKVGKLEDLYYSTNTLKAQELEDVHVWYYTTIEIKEPNEYLSFEGIDTFADIYVNGKLVKTTDNMFLPHEVRAEWNMGANEIVVHIKPTMLEVRKIPLFAGCYAQHYNYASLYVRKAAHMFGWDILPRIVSAGLWKPVVVKQDKEDKINEVYLGTNRVDLERNAAQLRIYVNTDLSEGITEDYSIRLEAKCGDSSYNTSVRLWHNSYAYTFDVENCKFWWPKNAGEPSLYDVTVTLLYKGEVRDTYSFKHGIRTIKLDYTEMTDNEGNGEFCFYVNGKKIFILGTNWVPMDSLHCDDPKRLPKALELLDDVGCNMVRCWGGNVYETDEFFDFCDEHGILIWQDFAMACGSYPRDERFCKMLEEEAVYQIKRLRNHAALALWAGDNECDDVHAHGWSGYPVDPSRNKLTREVLKSAVEAHDYLRSYLPSSPYISREVFLGQGLVPENHLWGPRDYFKGNFYKNTFCHFVSETGYQGFNSPKSLKRFLKEPEKIFEDDGKITPEYVIHATCTESDHDSTFAFRIQKTYDQVVTLFGKAEDKHEDLVRQSQISQAEANKYFIEKFRLSKWLRTGFMWWNLLDGWPQVSDAVVDYYYVKKLSYHYIKRSQEPVCFMFDEPENGKIRLVGVNDLPKDCTAEYTVRRISGKKTPQEEAVLLCGKVQLNADEATTVDLLPIADGEKEFYLIEWKYDGKQCKNHFVTNIIDIDYKWYMKAIEGCGMNEFEGF